MGHASSNSLEDLIALLKERSVKHGSFTLASGRQSSYYVDARLTTMSASGLELIGTLGLALIREREWNPTVAGGLTLGADPVAYAIALASRRSPPTIDAFTVRKDAKRHGLRRRIEGCFEPGATTAIVEDVITTGASAMRAAEVVIEAGGQIVGVLAVVDREEGGRETIERAGFQLGSLVRLSELHD